MNNMTLLLLAAAGYFLYQQQQEEATKKATEEAKAKAKAAIDAAKRQAAADPKVKDWYKRNKTRYDQFVATGQTQSAADLAKKLAAAQSDPRVVYSYLKEETAPMQLFELNAPSLRDVRINEGSPMQQFAPAQMVTLRQPNLPTLTEEEKRAGWRVNPETGQVYQVGTMGTIIAYRTNPETKVLRTTD